MSAFKTMMLTNLMNVFLSMLTPDLIKQFLDVVLDFAEDYVEGSKSTVDDRLLLPLLTQIRVTLDIPDNDEVEG